MFTDIAGYSTLMGADEDRAVAILARCREIVRPQVEKFGGRILDEIGDGMLASFDSGVSAVECAREIQTIVGAEPEFDLRIGIHIGDVLVSDKQVVGDGVNVASRIHGLAAPGSICISDRVFDDLRNHPEFDPQPLGERELKNLNRRITVYVLAAPGQRPAAEPLPRTPRRGRVWAAVAASVVAAGGLLFATGLGERLLVAALIELPRLRGGDVEQQIGFVRSADGTRIAYATSGQGPALVHVLGWASHVERGLSSPAYNPSIAHFAERYQFVHYDGRGAGLSDRNVTNFSIDARVADLEAVIDGLGLDRVAIMGLSAGGSASIAYTLRHPEKVRRLILIATAGNGASVRRANPMWNSIPDLVRNGWGRDDSSARKVFTALIGPHMSPIQQEFLSELLQISMTGDDAANFLEAAIQGDASDQLAKIAVPTLVIHARGDLLVPFEAGGRELAAGIPNSRLVVLESDNHGIPPGDPTYPQFVKAIDEFLAEDSERSGANAGG